MYCIPSPGGGGVGHYLGRLSEPQACGGCPRYGMYVYIPLHVQRALFQAVQSASIRSGSCTAFFWFVCSWGSRAPARGGQQAPGMLKEACVPLTCGKMDFRTSSRASWAETARHSSNDSSLRQPESHPIDVHHLTRGLSSSDSPNPRYPPPSRSTSCNSRSRRVRSLSPPVRAVRPASVRRSYGERHVLATYAVEGSPRHTRRRSASAWRVENDAAQLTADQLEALMKGG